MTVSIDFFQSCPCCNRMLRIKPQWSDKNVRCSHCSFAFRCCRAQEFDAAELRIRPSTAQPKSDVAPLPPSQPRLAKPMDQSILLVDDDREVLRTMGEALNRQGLSVTAVHHPRMAMSAVRVRPYAVAILDYSLPEYNGIELMRELQKFLPALLVIILSGNNDTASKQKAFAAGAFACLEKPCSFDRLRRTLDDGMRYLGFEQLESSEKQEARTVLAGSAPAAKCKV